MIGLFGSAAGKAILNTLPPPPSLPPPLTAMSTPPTAASYSTNKTHRLHYQQSQQRRQQPPCHAGMIAKSRSLDYEFLNEKHRTDDAIVTAAAVTARLHNSSSCSSGGSGSGNTLLATGTRSTAEAITPTNTMMKKPSSTTSGFWKLFESEKVKGSLEDISSASSKHR